MRNREKQKYRKGELERTSLLLQLDFKGRQKNASLSRWKPQFVSVHYRVDLNANVLSSNLNSFFFNSALGMCSHRVSDFSEKDAAVVQCPSSLNIILDKQHTEHIGLKIL